MTPMNRNLIKLTDEDKKKIHENFGIDDEHKLQDGLTTLIDWCSKQHHFVGKNINNIVLEKNLVLSKGSVEEAKRRIDRLFTARSTMEDLVLKRTPEEFRCVCQEVTFTALPKLNPTDQTRVTIFQFLTDKIDDINLMTIHRFTILLAEYRYSFDYAVAERHVYDLKYMNLSLVTKLNPMVLKKIAILAMAFGLKIKGVHLLNAPLFVDKVVFLLKQVFKGKLAERIHVHSTYEDFQKHVSKEVLPSDYGGEEQSISKLHAQWVEELWSPAMAEYCIASDRLVIDESKRTGTNPFNNEYMGMPGNFRKLNVD